MQDHETFIVLPYVNYRYTPPCDLNIAIALIQSKINDSRKIGWICRCLYPLYAIQIETPDGKKVCFYDAYFPLTETYQIPSTSLLQKTNTIVDLFSETANLEGEKQLLETIEKETNVDTREQINGLLPHETAEMILQQYRQNVSEKLTSSMTFTPASSEDEVLKHILRAVKVDDDIKILSFVHPMFVTVSGEIIKRQQKLIDEQFDNLEKRKKYKIDRYTYDRQQCEQKITQCKERLNSVILIQMETNEMISDIDHRIAEQLRQRQNADRSTRYRIDNAVRELQREKNEAQKKHRELTNDISTIFSDINNEQNEIKKINNNIQETRDYFPDYLKNNIDILDKIKILTKKITDILTKFQNDQKRVRTALLDGFEISLVNPKSFNKENTRVSLRLAYLPLYLVQKRKYFGLQRKYYFMVPCSLPTSTNEILNPPLSKYFQAVLAKMRRKDLARLKKIGKKQNELKKAGVRSDIQTGLTYLQDKLLIRGLNEINLKKFKR